MNEPTRYRDEGDSLGQIFAEASELRPWQPEEEQRTLRAVTRRLAKPAPAWGSALRFALASTAVGLAVIVPLGWRHRQELAAITADTSFSGTRDLDLGAVGQLSLTEASLDLPKGNISPAGYRIALRSGRVCARVNHRDLAREGPLLVDAPHLHVTVIGTRFCVDATGARSTITVSEGRVRVQGDSSASAFVSAGETLASDAPALAVARVVGAPAALTPAPSVAPAPSPIVAASATPVAHPARPSCAAIERLDAKEDCYAALVAGDDLAAEDAVYSLALLRRDQRADGPGALSGFHAYLARFPNGALAPEAAQNILSELMREQRSPEALAAADDYLRRFVPAGGLGAAGQRALEVALTRAKILRSDLGRFDDALAAYSTLLAMPLPAELREEALFAAGECEQRLGHTAAARDHFARYLAEFPSGPHVADVQRTSGGDSGGGTK